MLGAALEFTASGAPVTVTLAALPTSSVTPLGAKRHSAQRAAGGSPYRVARALAVTWAVVIPSEERK